MNKERTRGAYTQSSLIQLPKKDEILSLTAIWMHLEDSVLSEVSQAQKDRFCVFSPMWKIKS